MDAVTVSMSQLTPDPLSLQSASLAILAAVVSNNVSKIAIGAVVGRGAFAIEIAVMAGLTLLLFVAAKSVARPLRLPNVLKWRDLMVAPVAIGALTGTFSHVFLDSIMHTDIRPFHPFSDANPLLTEIAETSVGSARNRLRAALMQ